MVCLVGDIYAGEAIKANKALKQGRAVARRLARRYMNLEIRHKVEELRNLLLECSESPYSEIVENALNGGETQLERFLISNDLWGGAGSIRDQALIEQPVLRKKLQRLLIELGELQIALGIVHPKTEFLVSTYKQWEADGVI